MKLMITFACIYCRHDVQGHGSPNIAFLFLAIMEILGAWLQEFKAFVLALLKSLNFSMQCCQE
ncbi:hypothetical protein NQ315_004909 [Exocentrus adspersus]|uniref:Uncharacterized protein n=1 Tax=Exocentrus adspersus TaxID=1586481 RepID=A0AAV8W2M0_9CUCU|nr:hypothetical protein NQ315_004909 [Exocentrus adspersus]